MRIPARLGNGHGADPWRRRARGAVALGMCLLTLSLGTVAAVSPVVPQPPSVLSPVAATGFYRVARIDGRWWFVDPSGHPVVSVGVNDVTYDGDPIRGTGPSPYLEAVRRRYADRAAWADAALSLLRLSAFNTLGAWSDPQLWTHGMAYTVMLDFGARAGADPPRGKPVDVYAPGFEATARQTAAALELPIADDPNLLGYFSDNELWWGTDWRRRETLLAAYLELSAGAPGRTHAVAFLRDRYGGSIARLNAAWRVTAADFAGVPPSARTRAYRLDAEAFLGRVAARYFAVAAAAIRDVDPHHLYLGERFQGLPPFPVLRAARAADVVSINLYVRDPRRAVRRVYAATGRPVLVTEFSFRSLDSGLPNTIGAGPWVFDQRTRGLAYVNYVMNLVSLPEAVGYHWFRWADEPAQGRADGENSNYGLVTVDDVPYREFLDAVSATNQAAAAEHSGLSLRAHLDEQVIRYRWGMRDAAGLLLGGVRWTVTALKALRLTLRHSSRYSAGPRPWTGPFP